MSKNRLLAALAIAVVATLATFVGSGRIDTPRTAEAFPGADNVVVVSQQCLPGNHVRINLSWITYNLGPQWVDLSLANNGFAPLTFIGLGPLASTQPAFTWDGLLPGLTHYLRINTLTGSGWFASPTIGFVTRNDCANVANPGATNLSFASQQCLPGNWVRANFSWTASGQGSQWFDLTIYNNGFAPFSFIGTGPLPASQNSLTWDGLLPGTTHYVRVNTLTALGWAPSSTLAFTTRNDCKDLSGFSINPLSLDGNTDLQALLDDVRIGEHPQDGFDRIVFEFDEDRRPDVQVRYVNNPQFCGSGNPVNLPGSHNLYVRFESAVAHNEMGNPTAPMQLNGTGDSILAARSSCDFEGVVAWVVGIDGQKPFRVTTASNPARVIVDVQR